MGKVQMLAALGVILAVLTPRQAAPTLAQIPPTIPCNGQALATPMAGQYTGMWQSSADYHFNAAFNTFHEDVEIPLTITGTLNLNVTDNGQVTGTASGQVNAPVMENGKKDPTSSGTGTFSGPVTGLISGGSAVLLMQHPGISMEWGLFGGGNNGRIERPITMPDYQLPVSGMDCISGHGTVSEQGFPTQWLVPDGALNDAPIAVPGVGTATGNWQIENQQSATFHQLSQQVDEFIAAANALLNAPPTTLTPASVQATISRPWQSLVAAIQQHPDLAPCLLERLGAWEQTAVPLLFHQIHVLAASSDLSSLRAGADLLRLVGPLNTCGIQDSASSSLLGGERTLLDRAIAARDWPTMALGARELSLDGGAADLSAELQTDLHAVITGAAAGGVLDAGRVAYALGDESDASLALQRAGVHFYRLDSVPWKASKPSKKSHAKKKTHAKRTHKKANKKKHQSAPKPTPTPTAAPRTVGQRLMTGLGAMHLHLDGGKASWQSVSGADSYVVLVTGSNGLAWSWAGAGSAVSYGNAALGGSNPSWPGTLPTGATWSVLAVDGQGRIIAAALRVPES